MGKNLFLCFFDFNCDELFEVLGLFLICICLEFGALGKRLYSKCDAHRKTALA